MAAMKATCLWQLLGLEAHVPVAQTQFELLCAHFADGSSHSGRLLCTAHVSGLPHAFRFTAELLWQLYLPLTLHLHAMGTAAREKAADGRAVAGVVAAAGAGKSSLVAILCSVADAYSRLCLGLPHSFLASLSMDAYHHYNVWLIGRGLKPFKGRLDTINAPAFAEDLRTAKYPVAAYAGAAVAATASKVGLAELEAGSGDAAAPATVPTVWLPEYDRAVTHDPKPHTIQVLPGVTVLLVEGLFLCRAGTVPAADSPAVDPAWSDVRRLLDFVLFLQVPLHTCRRRTVMRKARNGVTLQAAEAHYDRVDLATWWALQADKDKAVGAGPDLVLQLDGVQPQQRSASADAGSGSGGAELVEGDDCALLSATLRLAVTLPVSPPHQQSDAHKQLLVIGLNPCVQRTLLFPAGWTRGAVNRAATNRVAVGGKGQHCAIAALKEAAYVGSNIEVALASFLGGLSGQQVAAMFAATVTALADASRGKDTAAVASTGPIFSALTFNTGDDRPTRTCTTLLTPYPSDVDVTELVEASHAVPPDTVAALLDALNTRIRGDVTAAPPAAIALMGTVPPGAEHVYSAVSSVVAALPRASMPMVLLDGHNKAVLQPLRAGGIHCLKINVDELLVLVGEARAAGLVPQQCALSPLAIPQATSAAASEPAATSATASTADTNTVLAAAATTLVVFPSLQYIALTDGPKTAHLIQAMRAPTNEPGAGAAAVPTATAAPALCGLHVYEYALPPLPRGQTVVNPIGAGDTVAGAMLVQLLHGQAADADEHGEVEHVRWAAAFAHGLAAGSASCCTMVGAEYSAEDAAAVHSGIVVSRRLCLW